MPGTATLPGYDGPLTTDESHLLGLLFARVTSYDGGMLERAVSRLRGRPTVSFSDRTGDKYYWFAMVKWEGPVYTVILAIPQKSDLPTEYGDYRKRGVKIYTKGNPPSRVITECIHELATPIQGWVRP